MEEITKLEMPDYIGTFSLGDYCLVKPHDLLPKDFLFRFIAQFLWAESYEHTYELPSMAGLFLMYVSERAPSEGESEKINGKIIDGIGDSTFEGRINASEIEFKKQYDDNAIERGGAKNEVAYRGRRNNGHGYSGRFDFLSRGDILRETIEGGFVLQECLEHEWDEGAFLEAINFLRSFESY